MIQYLASTCFCIIVFCTPIADIGSSTGFEVIVFLTDLVELSRIMSKSQETPGKINSEQALAILGVDDYKLHFQFYKFAEKKWSPLQKIDDGEVCNATLLNDKFYYITETDGESHFQVFDIKTRRSTTLHPPNAILVGSAMCNDGRFIYFCGERNSDNSGSARVQKYDPQTNSLENLPPMPSKRWAATAIFNQGFLYVLGGLDLYPVMPVEKYDPETREWTKLASPDPYGEGVGVLDGKLYICGGESSKSVKVYVPENDSWQSVASMNETRVCCLVVAHEGKLLAIGGNMKRTVEVYDPSKDQWQIDEQMSLGLKMSSAVGGIVSVSCVVSD